MKIQYGFHLFIRKYLMTTCHNEITYIYLNIISFNCARQLHLQYIEETDRSNYFFHSRSEYAIYSLLHEEHSPLASMYIDELGIAQTLVK